MATTAKTQLKEWHQQYEHYLLRKYPANRAFFDLPVLISRKDRSDSASRVLYAKHMASYYDLICRGTEGKGQ